MSLSVFLIVCQNCLNNLKKIKEPIFVHWLLKTEYAPSRNRTYNWSLGETRYIHLPIGAEKQTN